MDLKKKTSTVKLVTPLCVMALFFFVFAMGWQHMQITRKNHKIGRLLRENASLRKNLVSIDGELSKIKDAASDVRIFQKELIKVIKDIDPKYTATFASTATLNPKSNCGFSDSIGIDPHQAANSAKESILILSSTQEKLRFETASLLGHAVSVRSMLESIPSLRPINGGLISSDFGPRNDPITGALKRHNGVDIAAPIGTPVYASADGIVRRATLDLEFGNVIEVVHTDGYVTTYGHLSEILTKINARVKRGEEIGRVGNTGQRCVGAHLHFGVSKNGIMHDPKKFMFSTPASYF